MTDGSCTVSGHTVFRLDLVCIKLDDIKLGTVLGVLPLRSNHTVIHAHKGTGLNT